MKTFSQSESVESEERENFISNYVMGRQLSLSKIDVSSIDMLFFPDQESFKNLREVHVAKVGDRPSQLRELSLKI